MIEDKDEELLLTKLTEVLKALMINHISTIDIITSTLSSDPVILYMRPKLN